jgi:hypothetical protein
VAGLPPVALGGAVAGVGSMTPRLARMRCRLVADTGWPSEAAYTSLSWAIVNVSGISANPMLV